MCFNERVEGRRWELSLHLKEKDWVCVWKRRPSWKGKAEHQEAEHCERERPEYQVIMFFFFFFLNIMLTWKILGVSEVSVLYKYIYIYIYRWEPNKQLYDEFSTRMLSVGLLKVSKWKKKNTTKSISRLYFLLSF